MAWRNQGIDIKSFDLGGQNNSSGVVRAFTFLTHRTK